MGRYVRKDGQAMANLSKYHPDFGCTPAEHAQRRAEREAGKRPVQDKARLRKLGKAFA